MVLEWVTIYYDDTKHGCRRYVKEFQKYNKVECKKASEFLGAKCIVGYGSAAVFLFEGGLRQTPYAIRHIIWKILMNKRQICFVTVIGGRKRNKAFHFAAEELKMRGYKVSGGCIGYLPSFTEDEVRQSAALIVHNVRNSFKKERMKQTIHMKE